MKLKVCTTFLVLFAATAALGGSVGARAPFTFYVMPGGSGGCTSWFDACALQTALTGANPGDQILVMEGEYEPTDGTERLATFQLPDGVFLYGGYDSVTYARDWLSNPTILSGDIDTPAKNDNSCHVVTIDSGDAAVLDGFTIRLGYASGPECVYPLGGGLFNDGGNPTLANVIFEENEADDFGGGMYNANSNPTLTNVEFDGNDADYGGGMYNTNSNPTLTNVTFWDNDASQNGGGMANYFGSGPELIGVTFDLNSAWSGGGMYNDDSNPTLTNVTFEGNEAAEDGGGMENYNNSSPTLTDVRFGENVAGDDGGGMYNWYSSPTLTNVTFSENSALGLGYGGGMYNWYSSPTLTDVRFDLNDAYLGGGMYNGYSSPTLTNVTFGDNSASLWGGGLRNFHSSPTLTNVKFGLNDADDGGGMANYDSSPSLTNAVFTGNEADVSGGGMYNAYYSSPSLANVTFNSNSAVEGGGMSDVDNSSPILTNGILWGNNPDQIYNNTGSTPTISYSDIQDSGGSGAGWVTGLGNDGGGNIDDDPLFVDAANADLRLQLTSPAIDAGNNAAVPAGVTTDLGGHARFVQVEIVPDTGAGTPPIVDMGAYETPPDIIYVDWDASGANNGLSWPDAFNDLQDALGWAVADVEIWVAEGTYKPGMYRDDTFQLVDGIALYGGFEGVPGTEGNFGVRDWETYLTILSGEIGAPGPSDNSYHVVNGSFTGATTIIDGFTISGGNASGHDWDDKFGGGFFAYDGDMTLVNLIFADNAAAENGGGLYINASSPTLTNVAFSGNLASDGGGMDNNDSTAALTNVAFSGNRATGYGGGMHNWLDSSPTLINVTFEHNEADVNGGGMYNDDSSPTLTNVTFENNTAADDGGGIYHSSGSMMIDESTFSANDGMGTGSGGGIYNDWGTVKVLNSTISGNVGWEYGAGVYNADGTVSLHNCTVSGNEAVDEGGGLLNQATLNLNNVTITGNFADDAGGGVLGASSTVNIKNSIIADNELETGDNNCDVPITSWGYNLESASDCGFSEATDLQNTDPVLGPLQDNAGPNMTHALLPGSPAINAAACTDIGGVLVESDQRGIERPQGATCDMGAYEATVQLSLSKSVDDATADPGQSIVFTIEVSNSGALTSTETVVSDTLPAGIAFAGPVELVPPDPGATLAQDAGDLPDLASDVTIPGGASVTVIFPVTVDTYIAAGTQIVNTAEASSAEAPEPQPGSVELTVNQVPPTAGNDEYETDEDEELTVSWQMGVLDNDDDLNGDALTAVLDTGPTYGTLQLNLDGSFTYTPTLNYNGEDAFTYHANDGTDDSNVATVAITINPVNDAPVANDDEYETDEDTDLNVSAPGVLDNDTDVDEPEGDTIHVAAADDSGLDGSLTWDVDGAFAYDPDDQFEYLAEGVIATDAFTYTVADEEDATDWATVTITITGVNDGPLADNDTAKTPEDTPRTIAVLGNDDDPDTGDVMFVAAVGPPTNGKTSTDGTWVTYTPTLNFNGVDVFTYTVSDGALTATADVQVTVGATNDPPNAEYNTATTAEDTPVTFNVLDNDSDPDGDTFMLVALGVPQNGVATFDGPDVTYTPALNFNGNDVFTYTISDGEMEDTAEIEVVVEPINDLPFFSHIADQVVDMNEPVGPISFTIGDVETPADDLTLAFASSNTDLVPESAIHVQRSGPDCALTINPTLFKWGTAEITIMVSDGTDHVSDMFVLTVIEGRVERIYFPLIVQPRVLWVVP
jgi:uncharacterized repeat protein (TIGR01451 family)